MEHHVTNLKHRKAMEPPPTGPWGWLIHPYSHSQGPNKIFFLGQTVALEIKYYYIIFFLFILKKC
jgi:hypothetical protein